jgi:5-formyltetrahydrofolate cyclo-ligase
MMTTKLHFAEEMNNEPIAIQKARLREYMKNRRVENENRDVKERLLLENFQAFLSAQGIKEKRKFFIYLSFFMEAPTDGLIETLVRFGHEVYCPRMEDKSMMMVQFGDDFTLSHMGIREPVGERYDGAIDYIVLPLLAVDEHGNRLGYGKGYYDRFLREYPKTERIGYCYDFQVRKSVPFEPHDQRLTAIVTDKRIIQIKNTK